jgi:hypothetical protein
MLVLLGLAFHLGAAGWGVGVLVILLVYIGCYSFSISPLFRLMTAELYPNRLRATGASTATVANRSANLLITVTFLTAVNALGKDVVFWIYAAFAAWVSPSCAGWCRRRRAVRWRRSRATGRTDASGPRRAKPYCASRTRIDNIDSHGRKLVVCLS